MALEVVKGVDAVTGVIEDLHGVGMFHEAVSGDILRKRNEFVSDLCGHNC